MSEGKMEEKTYTKDYAHKEDDSTDYGRCLYDFEDFIEREMQWKGWRVIVTLTKIERLERENKILALAASEHAKGNLAAFDALRSEMDRMKAALEFYAKEENYSGGFACDCGMPAVKEDEGKIARAALTFADP